jgi:myosin heavy subunit
MESLSNELRDLGSTSTIAVARDVFGGASVSDDGQSRRSSIRGFSVASQFKQSLQSLVDDLEKTQPHYIRCIKPNLHKAPNSFSSGEVLKQLRYSGMMEAIRIRREGYALREDHLSFFNRFSVLIGAGEVDGGLDIEKLVDVLSARLNVSDADWQIGHSKIFLKRDLSDKLERLAKLRVRRAARTLGRFGRNASHRRASMLLVTWIKFRLSMLKIYRARRASSKIAAVYRMHTQVKSLSASINAVIKIQAHQRRVAGSLAARKLRDPFFDLSHKELNKLMKLEKALLEEAIRLKDFKKAAEMEQKM